MQIETKHVYILIIIFEVYQLNCLQTIFLEDKFNKLYL